MAYIDIAGLQVIAAGQPFAAATLQQVRDNEEFLIDPPACSVYNSAAVGTTDAVFLDLTANSENYDNASMHSTSVSTSRITVSTAGRYLLFGSVNFAANATGERRFDFVVNGVTVIIGLGVDANSSGAANTVLSGCRSAVLAAGDYVEVRARQQSGGGLNVTLDEFALMFQTR